MIAEHHVTARCALATAVLTHTAHSMTTRAADEVLVVAFRDRARPSANLPPPALSALRASLECGI